MPKLNNGDVMPSITAKELGDGITTLPDYVHGQWALVLFYRGHWCNHCHRQLAGLHDLEGELEEAEVRVVALSADGERGARAMKDDEDLGFTVLYGVDAEQAERKLGLYTGERNGDSFVQPAQFLLDPEGVVRLASYSSGRTGRLSGAEALEEVDSLRD